MGAATRISYNNVTMVGAANPVYIDQFYGGGSGKVSCWMLQQQQIISATSPLIL
jgi:hypothetical protein